MKGALDKSLAFLVLVVLSPLLGFVAVLVRLVLGAPILFRQERPGRHGRLFTLYKFRTMKHGAPIGARDTVFTDAARLTSFGRLLRRTSIDELPQLFNIVRGDMSFVGPRPLLVEYLPLYTPEQARRHEVLPGLTGWAQVKGRNAATWEEKFTLDVWYVDSRSLWLDVRIVVRTAGQVLCGILRGSGISQPGQATALPFAGSASTEAQADPAASAPAVTAGGRS